MLTRKLLMLWMISSLMGYSLTSQAQLPFDPTVVHGTTIIDTVGNHITVINSPNTILNWQSFSIGNNASVYFQQQDAASVVLNRVTGTDPSQIFGSLSSNGSIWLINPYGVLFSENARIDAAGLVASTLDISNIDFLANRHYFNSTGVTGEVKNQGEVHTSLGGRAWLIGDRVQNEGLVQAPSGQVVLAAGKSIEFVDSGAPNVIVRVKAPENEAINLGSLVASGGNIDLHGSIVNQEGIVRANSVGTDAAGHIVLKADQATLSVNSQTQADKGSVQMEASTTLNNWGAISGNNINLSANEILQQGQVTSQGGSITMVANASTYLDGLVDVSNAQGSGGNIRITTEKLEGMAGGILRANGEQGGSIQIDGRGTIALSSTLAAAGDKQGGKIEVTGDRVFLLNADVDASGNVQGGTVYLGKGLQGNNELLQAREVLLGTGTEIKANGGSEAEANNGKIVVWSTQGTEYYGSLQAKHGGYAMLSSLGAILTTGDVLGGTSAVLFDSTNLTISSNPQDNLQLINKVFSGSLGGKPDLAVGDNFGAAVALEGDLLAVGAPGDSTDGIHNHGSVYLFTGAGTDSSGITLEKKLSSSTGAVDMPALADFDFFGSALALDGGHLAVGVKGTLLSDGNPGAVHLFTGVGSDFSGLRWQKVLAAKDIPGLTEFDFFGTALALDGNRLLIGAAGDSTLGENHGAVYLFSWLEKTDFNSLALRGKLTSGTKGIELANSDFFGWSVALDGDRMAIGAFNDSTGGSKRGAVHLFTGVGTDFTDLTSRGKLTSDTKGIELANSDFFGWSVALDGDRMAVGALGDDEGGKNHGAVYLLAGVGSDFSGLRRENKIAPDAKSDTDGFGLSLALNNERLVVGATESSGGRGAFYLLNWLRDPPFKNTPTERQATVDTAVQIFNTAVSGTRAILDVASGGKLLDMTSSGTSSPASFGRLRLEQMSVLDMQQIIDYRKEFKRNLFSEAIYKLELDPSLSDVPFCNSLNEINSRTCRITDAQRNEKPNLEKEQQLTHKSKYKTKIAIFPQIERKYVVLFGIDNYTDKTIPSLENTISDAQAVGQLFSEKLGYEVRVVKNASKADIIQSFNQLSLEMGVNDSVVIYYAGHGYINEKTGTGYWIPSDASAKDPSSWISNTSISEMLASIRSKQMVMVSDSCYSGAFTKEQKFKSNSQNISPEDILVKRSVLVMSSGGDEPVADEGRGGHSIFAWFLMQALGNVDNWKAGANIFEQVQRDVSKSFPQIPQYGEATSAGHEKGGDYLFEFRQLE